MSERLCSVVVMTLIIWAGVRGSNPRVSIFFSRKSVFYSIFLVHIQFIRNQLQKMKFRPAIQRSPSLSSDPFKKKDHHPNFISLHWKERIDLSLLLEIALNKDV